VTVVQDQAKLTVAASTTTSNIPLTLTATVTAVAPGSGTPTGTVSFYVDSVFMGMVAVNASGKAALTISNGLSAGNHRIMVVYSGSSAFDSATTAETIDFIVGRGT
jgi:hypothetical protein